MAEAQPIREETFEEYELLQKLTNSSVPTDASGENVRAPQCRLGCSAHRLSAVPSEKKDKLVELAKQRVADVRAVECLICFEKTRSDDTVWNCGECFVMTHLQCAKRWAEKQLTQPRGKSNTRKKNTCICLEQLLESERSL